MTSSTTISLAKYSFADVRTPGETSRWHHDESSGITVTFTPTHLKVTHHRKTLSSVDIQKQVQEANNIIKAKISSGTSPSNDDLPILAMFRHGQWSLGVRYAKTSKMTRRMQFRFHSEHDCTVALDLMKRTGVRFSIINGSDRPMTTESIFRPLSQQNTNTIPSSTTLNGSAASASLSSATFQGSDYPSSPPRMHRSTLNDTMRDAANRLQTSPNLQEKTFFTGHRSDERPFTAPNVGPDHTLNATVMPPRRELPFSRPDSRDYSKAFTTGDGFTKTPIANKKPSSSSQRPSTADLPPLEGPKYVTRFTKQVEKAALNQGHEPLSSEYFTAVTNPSSSTFKNQIPQPRFSNLNQPLSVSDSSENVLRNQQPFPNSQTAPFLKDLHPDDKENHHFADQIRHATHSDGYRDLQSFAAQSQDMRDNLLDHFFIQCIEDAGFTTLCQDIAANWRRIGHDLK